MYTFCAVGSVATIQAANKACPVIPKTKCAIRKAASGWPMIFVADATPTSSLGDVEGSSTFCPANDIPNAMSATGTADCPMR